MYKVGIVLCYLGGHLHGYFDKFLIGCKYNPTIDWLLFTDDHTQMDYPENVKVHYTTLDEMRERVHTALDREICIDTPRGLCNYKVMYGKIFEEELKPYDFWGFCDCDLVFGNLRKFFTDDIFDRVECEYLVCLLDGIFVPFFIEEYRFRSDTTALVKLEGVDTSEKARMFTNVEVYFPKKYVGEEEDSDDIPTWNYFIGFKVEDVNHGELGEIVAVDDSTMNVLFAIEKGGEELLLPAHEEFITKLDKKKRLLTVEVPDGLI